MARTSNTRTRIMDIAQDAVLAKGFDATSIDEIVAAAEISRGGFFYHFPDKNALALALIERYVAAEDAMFDELDRRALELADDPLQRLLIWLQLFAEILDDIPNGHPGCIVASATYQERLFDRTVREACEQAALSWRARFRDKITEVINVYPPNDPVDTDALADMVNVAAEGGLVLSKAFGDPKVTGRQVRLVKSYVKLLFSPRLQ